MNNYFDLSQYKNKISALKYVLFAISVYYIASVSYHHFGQFPKILFSSETVVGLCTAYVICLLSGIISIKVWHMILRSFGKSPPFSKVFYIVGISQLGKYLPGNVFQYIGRFALGLKAGLSRETLIVSMGLENFLALASVFLLVGVGLFCEPAVANRLQETLCVRPNLSLTQYILYMLIVVLLVSGAWVFRKRIVQCSAKLDSPLLYGALILSVINYLLYGIILIVLTRLVLNLETCESWFYFAWRFSLAWVVGYVIPGAPGGLGVRETVMIGVMESALGAANAVVIALMLRVISVFAELSIALIAYIVGDR